MEAKLAASARAEATLSAHDLALIARMSGPLRRVTLRPATAGPAAASRLGPDAAAARFDASGGRPMAAASQWAWGGGAEAGLGGDDDDDDDDDDSDGGSGANAAALPGQRTSASSAQAPRVGRGSAGGGAEAARVPSRNAPFPRAPSGREGARDLPPPGAEPEPTESPRLARRSTLPAWNACRSWRLARQSPRAWPLRRARTCLPAPRPPAP
jgi:hypothetical protein